MQYYALSVGARVHYFNYVIFTVEYLSKMAGEEEKLCEQIRFYQHLYDGSAQLHSNRNALENAWGEVARVMGKIVKQVKTDWKAVRDKYARAHKKWKVACRSGAGAVTFGYPKILTQLSWLAPTS